MTCEIGIFADDDIMYVENYSDIIFDAYLKYKNADIICFWVESKNPERKNKKIHIKKVNFLNVMKIASFEITFKKKSILDNNLRFDENLGAGCRINRGEEQKFLIDALKRNLKIIFINKKIAEVNHLNSTWFKKYDESFFRIQGEVFKKLYPKLYKFVIIQYAIRKRNLYKKTFKIKEVIKFMISI